MTIATGDGKELKQRIDYLQKKLKDHTIHQRIVNAFKIIDQKFPEHVRNRGFYEKE